MIDKRARPVLRDDGKSYESVTEAAISFVRECGCGDYRSITSSISQAARHYRNVKTAFGYRWAYLDADEIEPWAERILQADFAEHGFKSRPLNLRANAMGNKNALTRIMKRKGMTIAQLSKASGVGRKTIDEARARGLERAHRKTVERLAKALGCDTIDIMD